MNKVYDGDFDIDWLRQHHQMIHYFGLGFIQLKLDQYRRLHFYTPELDPIVPEEDVHNHRYDFVSKVMLGRFTQELFEVIRGETHVKEFESCKEGYESTVPGIICGIQLTSTHTYEAGSEYFISHNVFHRVETHGGCITLVTRTNYLKELAEVIRPVGSNKVCPFSMKLEEYRLWEIVESMLKKR